VPRTFDRERPGIGIDSAKGILQVLVLAVHRHDPCREPKKGFISAALDCTLGVAYEEERWIMTAWRDLIAYYQAYSGTSPQLKIATLAQWIVESGRGSSKLATDFNNFGGIKFRERMVGYAQPVDYQGSDGELTTYCKFASVESFVKGYWHFIETGPYDGYQQFKDDAAGYIRHIAKMGYSTDSSYVEQVVSAFSEAQGLMGLSPGAPATAQVSLVRFAVVVGHNRVATGASSLPPISKSEYAFNSGIAQLMKANAWHYNVSAEVFIREPSGSYAQEIKAAYAHVKDWGAQCSMELHFNSSDESATASRSQVLCRRGSVDARGLAQACLTPVVDLLKLKNGGVVLVDPGDRGGGALYALDDVPAVLCEPFFGSTSSDCVRVAAVGDEALALAYLRGVRDWITAKVA
jgi:hypothetical protein